MVQVIPLAYFSISNSIGRFCHWNSKS